MLVVDLSRALAGPHATMMLGDLGARVIKVEAPGHGDDTRGWGPPFVGEADAPQSTYFLSANRNKESIALDLKDDADRELLLRLVDRADVLVENFRTGVLERLELGIESLMARNPALAIYRFAIEDLYRQQEHVLDEKGEHLLSLSSRFSSGPPDAYAALSTADVKHPKLRLTNGAEVTLTYGQYRAILATNRNQADRAAAFVEYHKLFEGSLNTYASLYNGVLQRDWFYAQARSYRSTLEAALHGNNIPTAVVENLIESTRGGTEPLRRYHRLRKRVLQASRRAP